MKELVELRTAHSKTFDLGNGLRRVVIQQGQHYADRDTGRYEETPSAVTDDTYVPDFDYRFKGQHWSRFGRGKYKVGLARGKSITYTFPDVIPSVDGATVTYENAWQSTDLRLLCFPEGVKEEIVLKDSSAPSSFTFGITAEGVTLSLNGNAIDILDGDKVIGKIPAPLAVDANGSRSEAVLSLIDSGITITLDAGWLATAVYPITLDPTTVTIQPDAATGKDAYVYSYNNTTNYGTADALRVGRYTSTQIYRAFIEMSVSFIPSGSGIQSAVLSLYCIDEASTDDRDVDVFAVTGAWDEGTVTWDTQPTVSGTSLARTTVTAPNAWFSWSIASIVRDWMLGTATNRGLCFKGNEAGYDSANKAFASSDHATASYRPKLEIVYTARPTVSITSPNGTQASPTVINNNVTPDLVGVYSSTDSVDMAYRQHVVYDEVGNLVYDTGKTAAVASPGATVTVAVLLGYLRYGRRYKWHWMAWDANGGYSEWSPYGWFKPTLTVTPSATDIAAADHLYAVTPDGQVFAMNEGATDLGVAIQWEWVSKAFTEGHAERDKKVKRYYVVAEIPAGSTYSVQYSTRPKDLGDGKDWLTAYTIPASTGVQRVKIPIPIVAGESSQSPWFRIKLSGTGPHTTHDIVREFRIRRT